VIAFATTTESDERRLCFLSRLTQRDAEERLSLETFMGIEARVVD